MAALLAAVAPRGILQAQLRYSVPLSAAGVTSLVSRGAYSSDSTTGSSTTSPDDEPTTKAPGSHASPSFLHDPLAEKFVNCMMWDGKKSLSQRIFRQTLELVKNAQITKAKSGDDAMLDPMVVFHEAVKNVTPVMGTSIVRRSGRTYKVPVPLTPNRQRYLAIKWLITAARERKDGPTVKMPNRLAQELLDAYNNEGAALNKKKELYRLAESNRAYVHYRWG